MFTRIKEININRINLCYSKYRHPVSVRFCIKDTGVLILKDNNCLKVMKDNRRKNETKFFWKRSNNNNR